MNDLERDIARLIIETLALDHLTVDDIAADQPLFGQGLGLDSVDALELALALQTRYGLKIASDSRDARRHFETVHRLALYVKANGESCVN
ncbi:MAG: phosphopantetheine-binding protein [Luteibacter sp.]|jgi:acyl carrier protein|uniref:phosphopantetheine-binding protein n=1 Tax=Luteibacter TaxID=242605 RepID=UPI00056AF0D3|nr:MULTISPECIES: phosphopantetheine-binding protein [unclassified Luteibacter]MDQ7996030.1 phosphopantetheine-binding protein [Luteibacter sp.]MDQ8048795.1 phosphopantetheine-binding protein [Luteibacter sp.]MDR6643963.1 acyl carrier protein [Luteibacter sp. 1214]